MSAASSNNHHNMQKGKKVAVNIHSITTQRFVYNMLMCQNTFLQCGTIPRNLCSFSHVPYFLNTFCKVLASWVLRPDLPSLTSALKHWFYCMLTYQCEKMTWSHYTYLSTVITMVTGWSTIGITGIVPLAVLFPCYCQQNSSHVWIMIIILP